MSHGMPFSPALTNKGPPTPPPSQRKLGKRPMTAVQMQDYCAKMQRTPDYDSDYEQEAFPSGYPSHATNVPGLRLGPQLRSEHQPRTAQLEVLPEDEHARDLLEALGRPFPTPTTAPLTAVIHVNISADSAGGLNHCHELTASELESLYDGDDDPNDPGRLVPDPFSPDDCPRITAAERDAIVQVAQDWRREHGLPPLVRDTEDGGRWIDAAVPPNVGSR